MISSCSQIAKSMAGWLLSKLKSTHVSHILPKLGFDLRFQITAWAAVQNANP